jgi:hypothetical protein
MLRNLLGQEPQGKSVELALDPRRGVDTLELSLIEQWLGDDVEVIDLGLLLFCADSQVVRLIHPQPYKTPPPRLVRLFVPLFVDLPPQPNPSPAPQKTHLALALCPGRKINPRKIRGLLKSSPRSGGFLFHTSEQGNPLPA